MRSRTAAAVVATVFAAAYAAAALAAPPPALAARTSISLHGPHVNRYGTSFSLRASGRTSGRANYVVGLETTYAVACAGSYRAQARVKAAARVLRRSLPRNRRFTFSVPFFAINVGTYRLCAYVINRNSGKTFARAQASWRNSPPHLRPAPLGGGDCGARRFPDGSVYAQVAVGRMTCEAAEAVAFGADAAKGAPYSRAGLSCTAMAEGPGSTWASAWSGTYYAYACAAGQRLLAFNWGPTYVYGPTANLPLVNPGG
jgi:hypothetical protein